MSTHQTAIVLFDLALIIVAARLLGALARKVGQPPVIGELAAGILLGPMILGPHLTSALFPSDVRPLLNANPAPLMGCMLNPQPPYLLDQAHTTGQSKV